MTGCKDSFKKNLFIIPVIAIACFHWERRKYNQLLLFIINPMLIRVFSHKQVKRKHSKPSTIQIHSNGGGGLHRTSCCWGYNRALDLPATCPRRSTRSTRRARESSESKLHYRHRLDYVVSNRLTVSNHSSAPLNAEYPSLRLDRCVGEADTLASWALVGTATRS